MLLSPKQRSAFPLILLPISLLISPWAVAATRPRPHLDEPVECQSANCTRGRADGPRARLARTLRRLHEHQHLQARYDFSVDQLVGPLKETLCFWCDTDGSPAPKSAAPLADEAKELAEPTSPQPGKQNTSQLLLFTRANEAERYDGVADRYSGLAELRALRSFDPRRPTVLLIHGFRGSTIARQRWAVRVKDMILTRMGANVFYVDWSHHARVWNYYHALNHVPEIADDIHETLRSFQRLYPNQYNINRLHAIGHSLGAHVAGILGQLMGGRLERISALDPAGFSLESRSNEQKLSRDDARYVAAYHTDKYLGSSARVGDRDIYVNGGSQQPACKAGATPAGLTRGLGSSLAITCAHRMIREYISTFMGECIMAAYLCPSYDLFEKGECGFCAYNSSKCLAFGHEWQYKLPAGISLVPEEFANASKIGADKLAPAESSFLDYDHQKYYVKTGAKRPYCLFTYQVVVKFFGRPAADEKQLSYVLIGKHARSNSTITTSPMKLHRHRDPDASLEVFDKSGREGRVQGENIYTALKSCDKSVCTYYDFLPLKFNQLIVSQDAPGSLQLERNDSLEPTKLKFEAYVNFMAHVEFETRAKYSGPVQVAGLVSGWPEAAKNKGQVQRRNSQQHQPRQQQQQRQAPPGQRHNGRPQALDTIHIRAPFVSIVSSSSNPLNFPFMSF